MRKIRREVKQPIRVVIFFFMLIALFCFFVVATGGPTRVFARQWNENAIPVGHLAPESITE